MYLKQIMFLGYTVLQLFCSYNLWYMYCYLHDEYFVFYISTFRIMYAAPSVAVFCSSLMSLTDMSFRCFLNASEMAPVTRLVAVYQFGVCIPHTLFIFSRSLYITRGPGVAALLVGRSRDRFPVASLEFFSDIWGRLSP